MSGYPYPGTQNYPGDAGHLNYLLDFNTRPISGVGTPAYRFRFPAPPKH